MSAAAGVQNEKPADSARYAVPAEKPEIKRVKPNQCVLVAMRTTQQVGRVPRRDAPSAMNPLGNLRERRTYASMRKRLLTRFTVHMLNMGRSQGACAPIEPLMAKEAKSGVMRCYGAHKSYGEGYPLLPRRKEPGARVRGVRVYAAGLCVYANGTSTAKPKNCQPGSIRAVQRQTSGKSLRCLTA